METEAKEGEQMNDFRGWVSYRLVNGKFAVAG